MHRNNGRSIQKYSENRWCGMTKIELVNKLVELGYQAEMIDNIPYVLNISYKKASKVVKEIGYDGTYGVKNGKGDVE